MKTGMILGVTGQDGSYLAELLLSKGYKVIGLKRRTSLINTDRVDHIYDNPNFHMKYFDLNDAGAIWRILHEEKPDEIYNLAAQSHVRVSFEVSEDTVEGIVLGTLRLLNAARTIVPHARIYQASSSEMFGNAEPEAAFNAFYEDSKMLPCSPYACAKLAAHHLVRNYRESYDMHVSSGILFNHGSSRRGETFVTRKITLAAAHIKLGLQDELRLGNLDAKRDWIFAGDAVRAMWLMLQQPKADDYVIASNECHTVREFLEAVFDAAGLGDPYQYVKFDKRYLRPQEVPYLKGDYTKAKRVLGWEPEIKFKELAKMMYEFDLKLIQGEINESRKNVPTV